MLLTHTVFMSTMLQIMHYSYMCMYFSIHVWIWNNVSDPHTLVPKVFGQIQVTCITARYLRFTHKLCGSRNKRIIEDGRNETRLYVIYPASAVCF